ncbi:macrophage migration inhibitory factor [Aplysia californica]|uniref:L-dopachrome isomerase n=1 Tax=Aplysia californica TaxID=6500 RepID=A0ABM0JHQ7_APLCA|nr:macrophage migration inhibitory factor [Aplysia californica]
MPILSISTNLKRDQIPGDFLPEATKFVSAQLGKPENFILVQVNPDQLMSFQGSSEPCANISLGCIGVVSAEKNRELAPIISEFIEQKLGIKKDRFFICVTDVGRSWCIWNGSTFG